MSEQTPETKQEFASKEEENEYYEFLEDSIRFMERLMDERKAV